MKTYKISFFIALAFFLFFLDIVTFTLIEQPLVYSLMCLYVIQILKPFSWVQMSVLVLLLACESLIFYGHFAVPLLYLLLIAGIGSFMRKTCYMDTIHRYWLLILCMIGQALLIEWVILGLPISITYTFSKIFATLSILIVLTWLGL